MLNSIIFRKTSNFKNIIFISAILIIALSLRLHNLNKYSFWYDEAISALEERGLDSLPALDKLFNKDFSLKNIKYMDMYAHGFVYYWQKMFGKSEFALRFSSVMFSILSICALYILAKNKFSFNIAYLASLLLAISPFHIYYAQELRPYTAICFFTLVSAYSLSRLIDNDKGKYRLIYILSNIISIYFHYMMLLVLFAFMIFSLIQIRNKNNSLKTWCITHILIFILLVPIFSNLIANAGFVLTNKIPLAFSAYPTWAGNIDLHNLLFTFKNFSIGYNTDYYSFVGRFIPSIYFFLFLLGALKFRKNINMHLILFCICVPILFSFFISKIKTCYVDRYFFAIFPFYLLGVAIGLSKINKKIFPVVLLVIVAFNIFGLQKYYLNHLPDDYRQHVAVGEKQDIRKIARVISDNYKSKDKIVHTCQNTVFPLKFYLRQLSDNSSLIQEIDKGSVIFIPDYSMKGNLFKVDYKELYPTIFLAKDFEIVNNLERHSRLWVVFSNFHFRGEENVEYAVINKIMNTFYEDIFEKADGVFLYLFKRK